MMEKAWYKSKTVWAGIILFIYGAAAGLGYDVDLYKEPIISIATALGIVGLRGIIGPQPK